VSSISGALSEEVAEAGKGRVPRGPRVCSAVGLWGQAVNDVALRWWWVKPRWRGDMSGYAASGVSLERWLAGQRPDCGADWNDIEGCLGMTGRGVGGVVADGSGSRLARRGVVLEDSVEWTARVGQGGT
jgi:hypothetical protein